jgi:Na+-translocating ferredoxin:NAD+ oxidoreductase RnfE subunit
LYKEKTWILEYLWQRVSTKKTVQALFTELHFVFSNKTTWNKKCSNVWFIFEVDNTSLTCIFKSLFRKIVSTSLSLPHFLVVVKTIQSSLNTLNDYYFFHFGRMLFFNPWDRFTCIKIGEISWFQEHSVLMGRIRCNIENTLNLAVIN